MKTKVFAIAADIVLIALVLAGAVWLFAAGTPPAAWTTDRPLLPLSVEGSRYTILLTALGIVLGLVLAAVLRRGPDRVLDGEVVRYSLYDRLIHWTLALGYVLAFATAAWLLRWLGLQTLPELLPTLYLLHFVGAALIVFASATFVTAARVRGQDALFPRWRDVGPAIARLFAYLGIYGQPGVLGLRWPTRWQPGMQRTLAKFGIRPLEREEKFLAVEKVLSFTPLAILTLIVVGTGLVKAARYFFLVPPEVYFWATWLHDLSTWLTLIVLGAHLAAIFLVPRNWPGIGAMLTGRISRHVVEEEFPAWADELRRAAAGAEAGRPAPAPGPARR